MRQLFLILLYIIGILPMATHIFAEQEPIESIVAVVGREPIMASELAAQIQLVAIQQGLRPETQEDIEKLKEDVLEQMISERLFLIEARKDTSIKVLPEEVEQAQNDHIARISSQFESEEAFLTQLGREGLTLRSFKKRLKPDIENQLLKQRLISKKLSKISISKKEVLEFYELYKDSIPPQPEAVRLAHILITFQPSQATENSVLEAAEKVRQNAAAGADFATLAATYSAGPTAMTGGDLGFISADDVVPEFGRVAFNLSPGDISGPVRTQYGYHIIKCVEVSGKRARFLHILFEVNPTSQDSALSYQLIDSLNREIENGADFKELAKVYSADNDSRKQGGELGWFAIENLPPSFIDALDSMVNIDDIYSPVLSEFGLHILKKLDWQEGRVLTPENDFDQVREMARQSKTGEFVDKWLKEIREKTYVEIRSLE
ncbi:MAG: peptidylprolyl isomerase [Candidatus Zixiibacteriota bacterium]|nr:MAG: peptidylprolyl isomerase [candidate division Zixibacteria bacterium]